MLRACRGPAYETMKVRELKNGALPSRPRARLQSVAVFAWQTA